MPLFMVETLGLSERVYGLMFTINTIIIVLLEVQLNLATDHWPHRNALALGGALVAIGFGAFAFCRDAIGITASVIVWTFGEMILFPALSAQVADMAPADRRGEYMGLYTMAWSVAFVLGPWLGTATLASFGSGATWGGAFALASLSAVLMAKVAAPVPRQTPGPVR
jgi:MFS family permease